MFMHSKLKNKTKVLSVQLGKTLGLTKVPITETGETNQVRKKILVQNFFDRKGEGFDHQGGLKLWGLSHLPI